MSAAAGPRLCIDLRMYRHSGIGRYLRNLLPLLLPNLSVSRICLLGPRAVVGGAAWLADPRVEWIEEPAPIYSVAEQTIPWRAQLKATDLLWVPHFNAPLLSRARLVVTIHDIAPLAMPSILNSASARGYAGLLIRRAVQRAEAILTVSEFTSRELQERLAVPAGKIMVTYPGLETSWPERAEPHREPDGVPYLLFVGNVKPNKNLVLLLRALRGVANQIPHRLIVAGKTEGMRTADKAVFAEAARLGDRVRFTGEVSDEELQSLYAGASAFCMPSLYEGFGLPVLEAMASGCPVLCARAGSLPEVAGGAALYFDPLSAEDLQGCLLRVPDADEMAMLRQAGVQRAAAFRFDRCAEATAAVLNGLLENRRG